MAKKVVITAAMTGSWVYKKQNESVPYTPAEFAEEAYKARQSGAAMIHIHGRDPKTGAVTANVDILRPIYDAIKSKVPDLIVQITTSVGQTYEERIAPIIALKPDGGSLNTNSMNFGMVDRKTGVVNTDGIFANTFTMVQDLSKKMEELKVKPEAEIYDIGGLDNFYMLSKQGFYSEPYNFNFVWGVAGGFQFRPATFTHIVELIPANACFTASGVGPQQFPAITQSLILGGNARVGLEDNLKMPNNKDLAKGSWEQVEAVVKIAAGLGREPATPAEAREILGLRK